MVEPKEELNSLKLPKKGKHLRPPNGPDPDDYFSLPVFSMDLAVVISIHHVSHLNEHANNVTVWFMYYL